ncbi:N-acetylglucosamine-1-phosphodiester alpha-N-acetylglucosaminidase-like [Acanthaster planci]|uniref:N-acetylglucosamine-1-phosphodiester alpha-N-acetylglucosaminidase-like n=1 Tax=Acanthaster planci TaxID=133434 RepID=A0A8B7YIH4_ACAPL|nr:N-acetylglucosamine-1-phosphodiester alpha-N-acetylglucosaminidase-like [Acanthaster planci]
MAAPMRLQTSVAVWNGIVFCTAVFLLDCLQMTKASIPQDVLTPYPHGFHGSPHSQRFVRDCQPVTYGNSTIQSHLSHGLGSAHITLPITTTKQFMDTALYFRTSFGHLTLVNNPLRTLSVLEPLDVGGCSLGLRVPVTRSATQKHCLVAMNAGFFNTHTGDCYGNVISDRRLVKNMHGVQNAHFGIRADGSLVFGYLSEHDVLDRENPFVQLVGGVGWLLRDGEKYVEESKKAECKNSEETGSVESFFNVVAARTAVGSDREGHVILAHVDGKSDSTGVSLDEFADLLKRNGIINAINLDGGGSSTYVINGTVVSYATDECEDRVFRCQRQVSTILCVHEPDCDPSDCSSHGECVMGECRCHGNWQSPKCDWLDCGPLNCSSNGVCTEAGCHCNTGYQPPDCSQLCGAGTHGQDCSSLCQCEHGGDCDPVTGACSCLPGYTGKHCQQICPLGYHGPECQETCKCEEESCVCHHITGLCMFDSNDTTYASLLKAGQCLADRAVNSQNLVPSKTFLQDPYAVGFVLATVIALVSLMCNITLLCYRCTCRVESRPVRVCPTVMSRKYQVIRQRDLELDETDESESSI